jgi:serine/threonine protein kinase
MGVEKYSAFLDMPLGKRGRTRRRGGKFIYSGAYGCTFGPALKCQGSNTRKNGYISKIINSEDAKKEWESSEHVRSLNKSFKYFVYPDESCAPAPPNSSNEAKKCPLRLNKPVLLLSPYGGSDLEHIRVPFKELPAFFEGFLNIFDGISLLHKEKIAHNDIKLSNMVGVRRDNGLYNLRLIDFGLSRSFSHLMKYPKVDNYAYWSYDRRFLYDGYSPNKADIDSFMSTLSYLNFPMWMYKNSDGSNKINIKFGLNMLKRIGEDGEAAKITIIKASEVFALGRALYEACVRKIGYVSIKSGVVAHTSNSNNVVDVDVLNALFDLVEMMCKPDPFERCTLEEARDRFVNLMPVFRKAFV